MKWIGLIIIALPVVAQIYLIIKTYREHELLPKERFFMELIKRYLK